MKTRSKINIKEIGMRLREARDTIGITLDKMHEITGFSKSLISAAEKGSKKPSAIHLFALVEHFNVDINYILTGKGQLFIGAPKELPENETKEKALLREMNALMENHDMVLYMMLSNYLLFKESNKNMIDSFLKQLD